MSCPGAAGRSPRPPPGPASGVGEVHQVPVGAVAHQQGPVARVRRSVQVRAEDHPFSDRIRAAGRLLDRLAGL
ncbi:hypothetical protein C6N75_14855 [Streptomyces solincola]|uniref:Uncharacterized protein n=1 Tax=Streptomyces solincola TaxID=2100817 RepID=A0A2S9PVJ8_9ACTN|nr:hypothetical protein C6N75_14855 [Streptomyces solincola]